MLPTLDGYYFKGCKDPSNKVHSLYNLNECCEHINLNKIIKINAIISAIETTLASFLKPGLLGLNIIENSSTKD